MIGNCLNRNKVMNIIFLRIFYLLFCFYLDGCQLCDCVFIFIQKFGVYSIILDGDFEYVYYFIEVSILVLEDNN